MQTRLHRLLAIAFTVFFSGCCTHLGESDATKIAVTEINRRHLTLPQHYKVEVAKARSIAESGPDIPLYVISFNQPDRRPPNTLYEINVNRCTAEIQAFGDFRKSRIFRLGE